VGEARFRAPMFVPVPVSRPTPSQEAGVSMAKA
jgi:hypothetical protein